MVILIVSMVLMRIRLYITVLRQCLVPITNLLATMDAVSIRTGFVITTTIVEMVQMRVNSVTLDINSARTMNLLVRTSSVLENNFSVMDRMIVEIILMKLGVVSFRLSIKSLNQL